MGETITTDLANYNEDVSFESAKGKSQPEAHIHQSEGSFELDFLGLKTTDVGSFPPNAFRLCDMHGNVDEWCLDHWHENYEGAPIDGSAWLTENEQAFRVLRGGSWLQKQQSCRSAARQRFFPKQMIAICGFRVVCVMP